MPEPKKEEYSYQIGKITFVVQPVHKESGEAIKEILLKLMRSDLERA